MSLQFSDTSTYRGIIQQYERELGLDAGDISGNATKLKHVTADINLAWDSYLAIALPASGTWQYDDSNHTDYPIIKTNIVSGQRSYIFTTDEQSNLVLDIYKAAILKSADATLYEEIEPLDQQSKGQGDSIVSESTAQGIPQGYDKTANGIIFDTIPNYSATLGLKLYINREASYFTTADTTKKPGCPGIHHRYFVIKPAYDHARRKGLTIQASLRNEVMQMEKSIEQYFGRRNRDEKHRLKPKLSLYV